MDVCLQESVYEGEPTEVVSKRASDQTTSLTTKTKIDRFRTVWWFEWLVYSDYQGGPATTLSTVVTASGIAFSLIIAIVFLSLIRQNETIRNAVIERTQELEAARNEALAATDEAEAANQSKSAFLANMSHEIRTPLNAIIGFTEILAEQVTEAKHRGFLDSILSSGKTLLTLINDILDLSKVESGSIEATLAPFSPAAVFLSTKDLHQEQMRSKSLDFRLLVDEGIPEILISDEAKIRQTLNNLIDNAVKFTESGHVSLSVRSVASDTPDRVDLSFEITDTGIGIPEDQQERIFKAFTQQKDQRINVYGGTGVGLTITRQLVEALEGTIAIVRSGQEAPSASTCTA